MSIGEAIQKSTSVDHLLQTAERFWLPTDSDLPSHYRTQSIHSQKRLRWSSQWLEMFGSLYYEKYVQKMGS